MNRFALTRAEVGSAIDVSGVPSEVLLFPAGVVRTTKYEPFLVDAESAGDCIAGFAELHRDLLIDYEHATLKPIRFEGNAPAAGWLKGLRWAPSAGIYARIEWTARARQQIAAKEYRYLSPVYFCDPPSGPNRKLVALWQIALTNDPATIGAVPLVASRQPGPAIETPDQKGGAQTGMDQRIAELSQAIGVVGMHGGTSLDQLVSAVNEANTWIIAPLLGLPETADVQQVRAALLNEFGGESASRSRCLLRDSPLGMAVRLDAIEAGQSMSDREFYAELSSHMELQRRERAADPDNGRAFYVDLQGRPIVG